MKTGHDHLKAALVAAMDRNADLVVVGEALELSPVTAGLLARHPERAHLLPAADESLVGVAVGMAMAGKRPVVELAEPEAIWGALQQLGQEAGTLRDRGEFRAPVVVRVPVAPDAWEPLALLEGAPGISIAVVGDPSDAAALLDEALASQDPVVLVEPAVVLSQPAAAASKALGLGRARVVRPGEDVTVLALGAHVAAALHSADALAGEGIDVEVLDLRWARPLDVGAIRESVSKTGRVVVAGTSAGALAAAVQESFLRLESPPAAAGGEDLVDAIRASFEY